MDITYIPLTMGGIGLLAAFVVYRMVVGAMAFISREYKHMWGIALVVLLAIGFSDLGWDTALSFFIGALCSSVAGFIGMHTATKANVRTTTAAHEKGADAALTVAFYGGSVMGITVAAMGLLGLGFLYLLYGGDPHTAETIHGFGMVLHWWRFSRVSEVASSRKAPMSAPTWLARLKLAYLKTILATRG